MNNSSIQANLIRASYFNCTGPCIWSESQCISCLIRFWIISVQSISTLFSLVSVCHNSLLEHRPPWHWPLTAGWTLSSKLRHCKHCRHLLQLITWFNIEIKVDQHQVVRSCTIRLAPWTLHDPCFISVVTSGARHPAEGGFLTVRKIYQGLTERVGWHCDSDVSLFRMQCNAIQWHPDTRSLWLVNNNWPWLQDALLTGPPCQL